MNILALTSGWEDATVTDVVAIVGIEVVTTVAFFFLGAMLGSFLNVVLYRLPRRRNLLWPPSSCPVCGNRLALVDNLPVAGWLLLRGRCRHCGVAISSGYVWVEASVGVLVLALLYVEVHTGGLNLPLRPPNQYGTALWTIWYPQYDLLAIYAYHTALVFFLTCLVLFVWQGERLSVGLIEVALAVGTLVPLWRPQVQQVPWSGAVMKVQPGQGPDTGVGEAALGLVAGVLLGAVMGLAGPAQIRRSTTPGPRWSVPPTLDLAAALGIAGAWLGWQAVVSIGVMTGLSMACFPRLAGSLAACAAACWVAAQLALWHVLTAYAPWWPGPHTPPALMAGWGILALATALVGRSRFRPPAPAGREFEANEALPDTTRPGT